MRNILARMGLSTALANVQRRLLSVAAIPLFAATACSGTNAATGQTADGDATRHIADASPGESVRPDSKCGDTPERLVDYVADVPDAGRSAIQVPTIGVNGAGLFYLLNWNTPLGASEGGPGGVVMHLPKGASEPVRLATVAGGGSMSGQSLAVNQTATIFSESRDGGESQGAILSVSPGEEPATLALTAGRAHALVADEQNVYFVDDEGAKRVPLNGGPVRTLADQIPYSIMVARSTLYLAGLGEQGSLAAVPVDGGPVTTLVAENALQPVLCGQSVCWLNGTASDMRLRQLVPGDASPKTLATGLMEPHDIVFNGQHFFVTIGISLGLHRIPAAGGRAVLIETGSLMSSLALDDDCLYWSEASGIYAWALDAAEQAPEITNDGG